MINSLTVETAKRSSLFEISATLMSGIARRFLNDPKKPVRVHVGGEAQAGKKIMMDGALKHYFDVADWKLRLPVLLPWFARGKKNSDEYWQGEHEGEKLEVHFLNYHRMHVSSKRALRQQYWANRKLVDDADQAAKDIKAGMTFSEVRIAALTKATFVGESSAIFHTPRQHGGIDFIQNAKLEDGIIDLSIAFEDPVGGRIRHGDAFRGPAHWHRRLTISAEGVRDNAALFQSNEFQAALDKVRRSPSFEVVGFGLINTINP